MFLDDTRNEMCIKAILNVNSPEINAYILSRNLVKNNFFGMLKDSQITNHIPTVSRWMGTALSRLNRQGEYVEVITPRTTPSNTYINKVYDRTPERGRVEPVSVAKKGRVIKTVNEVEFLRNLINKLFEQNEKLLETVVSLTK